MEGPNRLKFVLIGLFLAAIAVGYLIFTQRFSAGRLSPTPSSKPIQQIVEVSPSPSPSPSLLGAATDGGQRTTKGGQSVTNIGVSTLPKTGFPAGLLGVFASGAVVAGWFLRKFPY